MISVENGQRLWTKSGDSCLFATSAVLPASLKVGIWWYYMSSQIVNPCTLLFDYSAIDHLFLEDTPYSSSNGFTLSFSFGQNFQFRVLKSLASLGADLGHTKICIYSIGFQLFRDSIGNFASLAMPCMLSQGKSTHDGSIYIN